VIATGDFYLKKECALLVRFVIDVAPMKELKSLEPDFAALFRSASQAEPPSQRTGSRGISNRHGYRSTLKGHMHSGKRTEPLLPIQCI
jgi:hypothetical protein